MSFIDHMKQSAENYFSTREHEKQLDEWWKNLSYIHKKATYEKATGKRK